MRAAIYDLSSGRVQAFIGGDLTTIQSALSPGQGFVITEADGVDLLVDPVTLEVRRRADVEVDARRRDLLVRAKARYAAELRHGFSWRSWRFDSDDQSRAVIASYVGVSLPAGFTFRSADNQDVPMDEEAMLELAAAAAAHAFACHSNHTRLKWEVRAAGSLEALEAVDLGAGWPPR